MDDLPFVRRGRDVTRHADVVGNVGVGPENKARKIQMVEAIKPELRDGLAE
jgi:hypothetical protein